MKNYFDVRGRVAFVTGASKGLGKMFADTLGDAGAKLFILATTREPLEAACREFREKGYECECFCGNITDAAAVDEAVRRCVERYGRIDILVNNAAAMRTNKAPEEGNEELF